MSKWTAGPWTYAKDPSGIATVAWVAAYRVGPDHGMTDMADYSEHGSDEADARLIAAAPELADACKAALNLAWEVGTETEDGTRTLLEDSRGDLYRQLRAALTKAGAL